MRRQTSLSLIKNIALQVWAVPHEREEFMKLLKAQEQCGGTNAN